MISHSEVSSYVSCDIIIKQFLHYVFICITTLVLGVSTVYSLEFKNFVIKYLLSPKIVFILVESVTFRKFILYTEMIRTLFKLRILIKSRFIESILLCPAITWSPVEAACNEISSLTSSLFGLKSLIMIRFLSK